MYVDQHPIIKALVRFFQRMNYLPYVQQYQYEMEPKTVCRLLRVLLVATFWRMVVGFVAASTVLGVAFFALTSVDAAYEIATTPSTVPFTIMLKQSVSFWYGLFTLNLLSAVLATVMVGTGGLAIMLGMAFTCLVGAFLACAGFWFCIDWIYGHTGRSAVSQLYDSWVNKYCIKLKYDNLSARD